MHLYYNKQLTLGCDIKVCAIFDIKTNKSSDCLWFIAYIKVKAKIF